MARKRKKILNVTDAELVRRIAQETGFSQSDVKEVVQSLKKVTSTALTQGYKVSLSGLVSIKPVYVQAKPKGEMVRNPATGETAPRKEAVPASFRAKATASPALKKEFPSVRTTAGKKLADLLA